MEGVMQLCYASLGVLLKGRDLIGQRGGRRARKENLRRAPPVVPGECFLLAVTSIPRD